MPTSVCKKIVELSLFCLASVAAIPRLKKRKIEVVAITAMGISHAATDQELHILTGTVKKHSGCTYFKSRGSDRSKLSWRLVKDTG